jgi:PII-like signaling protein
MKGFQLTFYTHENRQHKGILLYEWLLERAKKFAVPGGSVFQASAGFGRHGIIHEEHFFELAANVPVIVTFILDEEKCADFIQLVEQENLSIFFTKIPLEYGVLNGTIE